MAKAARHAGTGCSTSVVFSAPAARPIVRIEPAQHRRPSQRTGADHTDLEPRRIAMTRTALFAALTLASATAAAALQPGDLAFTAFNADEDGFAIVAMRTIAPNTIVHFTDNEWTGSAFNTGENTFAWVSGTLPLVPGTVVRFSAIDQATRASSVGGFGLTQSGTPGFSASGDTIFAFSASATGAPTQLIAALSSEGYTGTTLAGSGLTAGVNAVSVTTGADFAQYTGVRTGFATMEDYRALLHNPTHWTMHATGEFATLTPNMAGFEIAPVPEPETYALLLTGLGLIGWRLRQQRLRRAPLPLLTLATPR